MWKNKRLRKLFAHCDDAVPLAVDRPRYQRSPHLHCGRHQDCFRVCRTHILRRKARTSGPFPMPTTVADHLPGLSSMSLSVRTSTLSFTSRRLANHVQQSPVATKNSVLTARRKTLSFCSRRYRFRRKLYLVHQSTSSKRSLW